MTPSRHIFSLLGLLLSVQSASPVPAKRPEPGDAEAEENFSIDEKLLDEVVVTATRTPKALKEVPVVTRLISTEEIERSDASNIQDLLAEELPGLEFGYAMTQETTLNLSGFGGNAVLFLVDGERLAGETMDNIDYNRLDLDNVGQVEIVKGASSALYGANAVGGVVNLISRESTDPWNVNVNSRYRAAGKEWRNGANINFNSGRWSSTTNVRQSTVESIRLTGLFDTESKIHEIYGGNTLNVKERLTFRPTANLRLTARGGFFRRASDRSTYTDRYTDYTGGIRSLWTIGTHRNLEVSYSYDQYDKARYVNDTRTHDHDYSNRQHIVRVLFNNFFGKNALTVGGDILHDYLTTYQFAANGARRQTSADIFAQFDWNPSRVVNLVASVRDDYFSASRDNAVTARLASMFKFKQLSIRASYSGGFRAPSLKEMYMNFYMAGIQMIYGNPDLKPERSHNFNAAIEHYGEIRGTIFKGKYSATLSGYYNYYDRRITTTDFPGDDTREEGAIYANEKGVKVAGADIASRYRAVCGFGLSASYNYLHVAGRSIDSQFTQPRPHSATWRIDFQHEIGRFYQFYLGLSGRYLSKPKSRYETDGAYTMWKLIFQQYVWKGVKVNFAIDNLFNYIPEVYYWNSAPTPGRTWSLGISLDIDRMFR